ncbi:MAG TPA: AAA family ATPase [Rhabdochlamydiaceae bacterium]|jgi:predicted AAA+ superfamily ATPase|nr:AAA family ATPase [Rhabdochlamydiaceae bacterium]
MRYIQRFFEPPKEESYFLFGPRGTGKSTWIRRRYPQALWIDLLEPQELRHYSAFPERLRETLDLHPDKKVIVIDEIQKVPELLSLIHALIEEKKGYQFILTGSSARKLKRVGVDLLAGRALLKKMHPFMAGELGSDFSLEECLTFGLLPLVLESRDRKGALETYAALYLKEEVQNEGIVRQIGHFARFLEIVSFSHGQLLNTANIARECEISRKTVENYLQILEDLLLSFTLPVFTRRAQRALISHPKFYLFDVGVYHSLRSIGPMDRPEEMQGSGLEGMIAEHLRAWIDQQPDTWQLSFWRTRGGVEVDFVVYGPKGFWAIEVKNTAKISLWDTKGLESFREDYPESQQLFIYRGDKKILQNRILCVPAEEFLLSIHPNRLLGEGLS